MTLDATAWAALAFVLAALGATYTWFAWRRRGPAAGLRGVAWTLLPVGLWLTGTLRLASDVADDLSRWAGRLVFDPATWAGVIVLGLSAVTFAVSGAMLGRGVGIRRRGARGRDIAARPVPAVARTTSRSEPGPESGPESGPGSDAGSDAGSGLDAETAAILKRHGIS